MVIFKRPAIFLFFIFCIVLSSCKTRKVITDASGLRGKNVSGTVKERYSVLLNIPENEITNEKLYKFIDSWMGVPHRAGGMDKGGIDCSGFTTILQKEIYNRTMPRTASGMADFVKRKYEEELKEGDLVFFDFSGKKFDHVGIYLHNNKFVHVSTSRGVIISDLKDPWYYKYFSRCGSVDDNKSVNYPERPR
ncbi:lipoprotein Spr [Arcticibacter tournemirensis]|uniref:Glycoside hydrolase n=1 Tax=Arcticibacter tournemirensis TaxID=699437 RepID=A0A5M9GWH0_9SPHI|nr:NlpC/P60 family protein [Arcticibacter tournemirensis]KAA8477148.1 glycoside hydrolase [Arcticibacter tournemirensis]TQM51206.1 lipoprotein Spr [Arcticibacter tournemirensis]